MRTTRRFDLRPSTLAICLALGAVFLNASSPAQDDSAQPDKRVEVVAQRFHFSPAKIQVERGSLIEFRLKSRDTAHGFRILNTDVNVLIPARGRGSATALFAAEEAGRFEFECSKKCGAGHTQMRGIIIVKDSPEIGEPDS